MFIFVTKILNNMTNQKRKYKIALIGESIAGGGAEKVQALLSVYFTQNEIDVHHCIFFDAVSYEFSGSLTNLGKIGTNSSSIVRKTKRFFAFRKFLRSHDFDAVIDFRMHYSDFQELLFSKLLFPKSTVFTIHSGILDFYFPKSDFLSKLIFKDHKIVTVSEAIKAKILSRELAQNIQCIHNPVDFTEIKSAENEFTVGEEKYILAVGRMNDEVKQFNQLILAYSKSDLPNQNVKLLLLGEGKHKENYQKLVHDLNLNEKVIFKGFVQNPFPYYKNALFSVLSSKNEGFPNVIIEALATGTPVVSFDCFSGPKEIIKHNQNGLLVDDQNFEKLTEAMNRMMEDQDLYTICKQNAKQSVERFSLENIGKQWLDYLKFT